MSPSLVSHGFHSVYIIHIHSIKLYINIYVFLAFKFEEGIDKIRFF